MGILSSYLAASPTDELWGKIQTLHHGKLRKRPRKGRQICSKKTHLAFEVPWCNVTFEDRIALWSWGIYCVLKDHIFWPIHEKINGLMAIPLVLYSWSPAVEQRRKRCRQSTPTPRYNHYWHTLYTFETFFLLLSPKDQRDLKLEFSIFIPLVTKSDGPTLVINCSEKSLGIESLNFYSYPFCPDGPQRPGTYNH